jgi:autotransporter translocation and assembly factor TamB
LTAEGRLAQADLFKGMVSDADVSLHIEDGTMRTTFDGQFAHIDPAIPFADSRLAAALTGSAQVTATVRDLLTRTPSLPDYDLSGRMALGPSTLRGVAIDAASFDGSLAGERLTVARVRVEGTAVAGGGSGTIQLAGDAASDFQYDITRADLAALKPVTGQSISGVVSTKGRLTGPAASLRAVGDANVQQLDAFGLSALTVSGRYDLTIPAQDVAHMKARVDGRASFLTLFGQSVQQAEGTVSFESNRLGFDLTLMQAEGRSGKFVGAAVLHEDRHAVDLLDLTLMVGSTPWRLAPTPTAPILSWDDTGFAVSSLTLVGGARGSEKIGLSGTWRNDGNGALRITGTQVFLETLEGAFERPARYGGLIDLDATIRGTRDKPIVTGVVTITDGRVGRVTYQKLAGKVGYLGGSLDVDFRLDQSPGVWITASGQLPLALLNRNLPEGNIHLALMSSSIDLGLIEGLTDVVRDVSGQMKLDVTVVGTNLDPHFDGSIAIADATFLVASTGVTYQNGTAMLTLSPDRIAVDMLHLDDEHKRPLDVRGSLATHELRVGDLAIDVTASRFEVLHNEFGHLDVDASLRLRGRFEAPQLTGELTTNAGELKVDEILERSLFRPYATEPVALDAVDAVAALNPWNRLGVDIHLRVPQTLRFTGTNVQVTPGTPIGLGDIDLRVGGDLYFRKEPYRPVSISGSLGSIRGTYAFQGRRFQIDEANSSINFHGDTNPDVRVVVTREISGVQVRLTISGPLNQPELQMASTPALDPSDILSLIVFNTTPNLLTAAQQQELAVRAGALAAGFLATPLVAAIESELGIDVFEIEPGGEFGTGPKVTIGEEIWPGLVARFSRQFGQEPIDEATVEYHLSQILRLRATFSDAQSLTARSAFRRVERAGIDLLVFLSF